MLCCHCQLLDRPKQSDSCDHTDCCMGNRHSQAVLCGIIMQQCRLYVLHSNLHAVKGVTYAGDLFIASTSFGGQLPDYVFTSRDQGVGYYKDASMPAEPHTNVDKAAACNVELKTPESTAVPFVLKPRLRTRAAAEELD